jgi:hypothetical protein
MMEAIFPSRMFFLRRATRLVIPEDDILHSHHSEHINSYIILTGRDL